MAPEMMIVEGIPRVSHWNMEVSNDDIVYENEYPMRIFNAKHEGALNVYLTLFERDLEYLCRGTVQGFKIFLNMPGQTLKMARHFLRVPLSKQAQILIKPTLTYTLNDVRNYSPDQRQCFFNSERKLRFFKIYTQNNCESECLSNFTRLECGCVKFSMPSKTFYQNNLESFQNFNFFFIVCIEVYFLFFRNKRGYNLRC